jgi:putative salt-induced outer membrane protein YdiY
MTQPRITHSAAKAALTAVFGVGWMACSSYAQVTAPVETVPAWQTSAAAGLTLTRGNSDTLTATANILTQKKWDQHELTFGADATYGEDDGSKNSESLHGFGQYNRLFTERLYGYARVDALHDAVADVEYRLTISPGLGYYFIKNDQTRLSGEAGPAVIFEKQGNEETTYIALRVAERFEHQLNDRVRLWQSLEWLPQVDDFDNWILNAEVGVETQLTERLSLRVFAQDTYDNQPAAGRQENDLKMVTAVAYKF